MVSSSHIRRSVGRTSSSCRAAPRSRARSPPPRPAIPPQPGERPERLLPASFQFGRDQAVLGIDEPILLLRQAGLVTQPFELEVAGPPDLPALLMEIGIQGMGLCPAPAARGVGSKC